MGEGVFEPGNPEGRGAQAVLEIQVEGGGRSKNRAFCHGVVDFFWNINPIPVHVHPDWSGLFSVKVIKLVL